jgi:hypothetical protein
MPMTSFPVTARAWRRLKAAFAWWLVDLAARIHPGLVRELAALSTDQKEL